MNARGKITLAILELLRSSAAATFEIADALTYMGKSASYKRLRRITTKLPKHKLPFENKVRELRERERVIRLLSKLKKEGLVKRNQNNKLKWDITDMGNAYIEKIIRRPVYPTNSFNAKKSLNLKLVIFDIPEKDHGKRDWLRSALKNLGFKILQQSVWAGKIALPEDFFVALESLNLLPYVQILTVTRSGTMRHVL